MLFAKFKKIMTKHIECKRPHAPKTKKTIARKYTHAKTKNHTMGSLGSS
jgi:hypothetical protein